MFSFQSKIIKSILVQSACALHQTLCSNHLVQNSNPVSAFISICLRESNVLRSIEFETFNSAQYTFKLVVEIIISLTRLIPWLSRILGSNLHATQLAWLIRNLSLHFHHGTHVGSYYFCSSSLMRPSEVFWSGTLREMQEQFCAFGFIGDYVPYIPDEVGRDRDKFDVLLAEWYIDIAISSNFEVFMQRMANRLVHRYDVFFGCPLLFGDEVSLDVDHDRCTIVCLITGVHSEDLNVCWPVTQHLTGSAHFTLCVSHSLSS
ncbi:hypothetical protein Tco_1165953 [Tanacetum coccineum]